jgi:hypothetical protein
MSLLPPSNHNEGCPPAYGGCTCSCHHNPGTMHCVPCCYPESASSESSEDDESIKEAIKRMRDADNRRVEFFKELTSLINKYSIDNDHNVPDYVLSQYIENSLYSIMRLQVDLRNHSK